MGAQGKTRSPANSTQRVKVYHLNDDEKWDDRGTGYVTVDYLERSEDLGLFVVDEDDNETLLMHPIRSDEIYRRQEDTIISWQDPEYSTELALSFQEATGCSYIWDQICSVQRNMHFNTLGSFENGPRSVTETLETSGKSQANDEAFHSVNSELRELPAVDLSTLPLILKTMVESGIADRIRVIELLVHDQDFFPKLIDLFRICEDLENVDSLHMIFKIVKGIILLNSPQIFDKIFGDGFIMDIIGSLEYDPEVPHVQRHRAFLKEHVVFKEAIPINDPLVLSKIHQAYRVGYIKDVVLPRILDDATIASLTSIVHANNAAVISSLKDDSTFIHELFARLRSPTISAESKKNLVLFLHEFCSLAKSLQVSQILRLFRDLLNEGIFDIITDALQTQDKKLIVTGTDIVMLFLSQDPNLLRAHAVRPEGSILLGVLVRGLITDFGEEMHCQFLEILRCLLDPYMSGPQKEPIIEVFYEKHLDQLIDVITSSCPSRGARSIRKSAACVGRVENHAFTKPEILSNICELLCFCVLHHPYRIKSNFLLNNVIEKVLFLTRRRERYLVVAAVRFMRAIISRNDDQLLRHVVKNNLLKPIVEAFVGNGNRYNLLNSAVLELFEYMKKDNLKILIIYLVESFWNELAKFSHLATIHSLKLKYEQSLENCETRNTANVVDTRKRMDERALEKEEEDYFNEDSDEEDTASAQPLNTNDQEAQPEPNGSIFSGGSVRQRSGLVDYDDDEDDDDYNPMGRFRKETSIRVDSTVDSPKLKRKVPLSGEELESAKKRVLDKKSSDSNVAHSTCTTHATEPPSNKVTTASSPPNNAGTGGDCNSDEDSLSEKKHAVQVSCSNCLPNNSQTIQSSGENCPSLLPPNGNKSPPEIPVNGGADVNSSEPYSVR